MSRFAAETDVTADRSRAEIEATLARYGADAFMYGWEQGRAVIGFRMHDRQVRFSLPMPDRNDPAITHTPAKQLQRNAAAVARAYEQATRQRWRALALVVKAKLEAVESGITVFEDEFLAHLVLPDGQTMGDWARPQVARAYATGVMPATLLGLPAAP